MFETAETIREKRQKSARRIQVPGKGVVYASTDPIDIARELRAKSKFGKREAKLKAAEEKQRRG